MKKNDVIMLLDEYNSKMAEVYNELLVSSELPLNFELSRIDSIEKIVNQKMFEWMKRYKSGFDDNNLYDYLVNTIDSETAYLLVVYSSYICDDGVPTVFINLLERHKKSIQEKVTNYLIEIDWENHDITDSYADDKITSVAALLSLLSDWTPMSSLDQLIVKYSSIRRPYDIISDALKTVVISTDSIKNSTIMKALSDIFQEHKDLTISGENLLISLVEKNKGKNNDAVYGCLKTYFEAMSNKQIALICFADLNDKRAVQYLRSWLCGMSEDKVEPVIIKEVISSLKRMGDKTEDLEAQYSLE